MSVSFSFISFLFFGAFKLGITSFALLRTESEVIIKASSHLNHLVWFVSTLARYTRFLCALLYLLYRNVPVDAALELFFFFFF